MKLFKKAMALGLSLLPVLSCMTAYAAQPPVDRFPAAVWWYATAKIAMIFLAER